MEKIIKMKWAVMPLNEEEMSKVPENHRIRPYLLFKDMGDFYYAFPATSKFWTRKSIYQNETLIVRRYNKSLVMLGEIFKLPKDNIRGFYNILNSDEVNELYKKMNANIRFANYPIEVMDELSTYEATLNIFDFICVDGNYYLVIDMDDDNLKVLRVYNYPCKGTVKKECDGLSYFIDVRGYEFIRMNSNITYVSSINGVTDNLEDYRGMMSDTDIKLDSLKTIPLGTIISYVDGDTKYLAILLNRDDTLTMLVGLANQMYRDFNLEVYPLDYKIPFNIEGMLSDERIEKLRRIRMGISNKKNLT